MEIWKDVAGWEGYYQVSNHGRIKSLERKVPQNGSFRTIKETIMTPMYNRDGYGMVKFTKNNIPKTVRVHRVVAENFIPRDDMSFEVNHKNFNRKDNRVENLEWVSHSDNVKRSAKVGRYRENKIGKKNGRAISVSLYSENGDLISEFDTIGDCASYFIREGYSHGSLNTVRSYIKYRVNKNEPVYGFTVKYN